MSLPLAIRKQNLKKIEDSWRQIFLPPKPLTVSEWVENNIVLLERDCAHPGPVRLDRTPWLRTIFEDLADDNVERITLQFASQAGKTFFLMGSVCWMACESPGPLLLVYPNESLAQSVSETRLDPLLLACPEFRKHVTGNPDHWKKLEKHLDRMTIRLVGAGSESSLASRPIRVLLFDESSEYTEPNEKHNSPIDLAEARTKTFFNRKILHASTPKYIDSPVSKAYVRGSQSQYYVPCPYCKKFQTFKTSQLDFHKNECKQGDEWDHDLLRETCTYRCEYCDKEIKESQKRKMLNKGEWRAAKPNKSHHSYQLNSIYSLPFGHYASEFIKACHFMESNRAFQNSYEGVPYEQITTTRTQDEIQKNSCGFHQYFEVLDDPLVLIASADYGESQCHFAVHAFYADQRVKLIDYGVFPNLDQLALVTHKVYSGKPIRYQCIDAGYDKDLLINFARQHSWTPVMGRPGMVQPIAWTTVNDHQLMTVQGEFFKEKLQVSLRTPPGSPGAYELPKDCRGDFPLHLASEVCVETHNRWGHPQRVWKRDRNKPNHWLDCTIYAMALFLSLGLINIPILNQNQPKKKKKEKKKSYLTRSDGRSYWDQRW